MPTVRDHADPKLPKLQTRDWLLAIGAFVIAVLMTYICLGVAGLSLNLTLSLYNGLVFSLFSTFFYAKLVRDHKELNVEIWSTLCRCGKGSKA